MLDLVNRHQLKPIVDQIYPLSEGNRRMIQIGRGLGAHVKLAGSGGAAVGIYEDEKMFESLTEAYRAAGFEVFKPRI